MLRWCERHDVGYVVGLARNKVLERSAEPFMDYAKKAYGETSEKQRKFHEIRYAANTWDRERRVIVCGRTSSAGSQLPFRCHQSVMRSPR